jgi:hypothetical protein
MNKIKATIDKVVNFFPHFSPWFNGLNGGQKYLPIEVREICSISRD